MRIRLQLLLPLVVSFLLAASATAQTLTEFPLPSESALPTRIIAGADGNLWFIEARTVICGEPKIGRITMAGSVVDFPIQEGFVSLPNDVASGPHGNIWFTQGDIDGGHSAINRMTPSGTLTRFPVMPEFTWMADAFATVRGNLAGRLLSTRCGGAARTAASATGS